MLGHGMFAILYDNKWPQIGAPGIVFLKRYGRERLDRLIHVGFKFTRL